MKTKRNILTELLKKSLVLGGVLLFFASTGQTTKTGNDFKSWDTNNDNRISRTEFTDRYSNDYVGNAGTSYEMNDNDNDVDVFDNNANNNDMVDNDRDDNGVFDSGKNDTGILDDNDNDNEGLSNETNDTFDNNRFYESSYLMWDADKDNRLNQDEWQSGYDYSYGDYLNNDFNSYDTDKDGYLEYQEYYDSLGNTDYYSKWDTNKDNSLDNKEYSDMVFDSWDRNKNGYIDQNEYNDYSSSYLSDY